MKKKPASTTVLEIAETTFIELFSDTAQLVLDGTRFDAPFEPRPLALVEARRILLESGTSMDVRDEVWRHLIERSRNVGGEWTLAVVGMAAPMLKRIARLFNDRYDGHGGDLASEILTGFLDHLATMDPERPGIAGRLRWACHRAAASACTAAGEQPALRTEPGSMPPPAPAAHPDVVLARAVRAEVLTDAESDLIGMTRLEDVSLAEAAVCLGITANAAKIRRQRAEARLAAFLAGRPVPGRALLKGSRARQAVGRAAAAV
jgi:DNA-directed RNA polymerase specialized sigma24 family protein